MPSVLNVRPEVDEVIATDPSEELQVGSVTDTIGADGKAFTVNIASFPGLLLLAR